MFYNKNNAKSPSMIRVMNALGGILLATMLTACSNLSMNHNVCDLRVLSLQIQRQSEEALTGSLEAKNTLKNSQEKLKQLVPTVVKQFSNQKDADKFMQNVVALNADIDLINQNQKNMNHIYDMNIAIAEVIPGIQAEYNLMVDVMARKNYSSTQVVIAKNQVFIAERILRSLSSLMNMGENSFASSEDFNADVETFSTYLKAQLEGNPDLGVVRINDPDLRSSLESIQRDTEEVLLPSALNLNKIKNEVSGVTKAVKDIQVKSEDIFNELKKIE